MMPGSFAPRFRLERGDPMLLLVNADNISGEGLPYLIDGLMARGAASVHAVPAVTKKGRSEFLFFIDAPETVLDAVGSFLALELDTLGMRVFEPLHVPFAPVRHSRVDVVDGERELGTVRVKIVENEEGATCSCKAEFDDLESLLKGGLGEVLSFKMAKGAVELAATSSQEVAIGPHRFTPAEREG